MIVDELAILKGRIADLFDQLELAHHDIDKLLDSDGRFCRRLLRHLDAGRTSQARAMVRWRLEHQP
ncbi:MAG TPA: hypothetical protein VGX71_25475 [Pseudaminobacter sp.]|nr:hypothetical protein [Pseudaminobacter sp.]